MPEQKAAKAFITAANDRMYNPYHFANIIKVHGGWPAAMLHRVACGWFQLNEIDYRYGIGDPIVGEMGSRIVLEVLADYEELPDYNPGRGFAVGDSDSAGTFSEYESTYSPSFIQRGAK